MALQNSSLESRSSKNTEKSQKHLYRCLIEITDAIAETW